MKQIKAFVHRNRVADLIHELEAAGFRRLSLFDEDDEVARAVEIFRRVGRTGRAEAGAVYVSPVEQAFVIDGET